MGRKVREQVVDTNIILRFLVGDNKVQQKQALKWFQDAEKGKIKLVIHPLVVAESCFVLESFYKKGRNEISERFEVFLSQKWLDVVDRKVLIGLWEWYNKDFHFVDSFLLAWSGANSEGLLSFDKKVISKVE